MNEAYVFQEKYRGLQIFVYNANSIDDAKSKLTGLVASPYNWIYLCKKIASDVK